MNEYIQELIQFINQHGIITASVSHQEHELCHDGITHSKVSFYCRLSELNTKLPFSIKQSMIFMLLDAYIDNINPEISNENFKTKYDAISEIGKNEIIIKEIYRIFRFLRNKITHDVNAIITKDDKLIINGKKNSILKMNESAVDKINYIVYFIVCNDLNNEYNSLILQNLYEDFRANVIEFNDDITKIKTIKKINVDVKFKCFNRFVSIGAKFKIIKEKNSLSVSLFKDFNPYESENYFLKINNMFYLIPEEALTRSGNEKIGEIKLPDIKKFEIDINSPNINSSVYSLLIKHISI